MPRTSKLRSGYEHAARVWSRGVMARLDDDWANNFADRLSAWSGGPTTQALQSVDALWADLKDRRPPQGSLTDWAATVDSDHDPDYPTAAVAQAILDTFGLRVPDHEIAHLLRLSELLIAQDSLARELRPGPPPSGGRTNADMSVSEMAERSRTSSPSVDHATSVGGARQVVRAGSELGQYDRLPVRGATPADAAEEYTQIGLANGITPPGYDDIDITQPRYARLGLQPGDLSDPTNDFVQRQVAQGYDTVTDALRSAAQRIATNQGSKASLAQSLDRGQIINAAEGVATIRGDANMDLGASLAVVAKVADEATPAAVAALLAGDSAAASDDVDRATEALTQESNDSESPDEDPTREGEHGESVGMDR